MQCRNYDRAQDSCGHLIIFTFSRIKSMSKGKKPLWCFDPKTHRAVLSCWKIEVAIVFHVSHSIWCDAVRAVCV